MRDDNGLLQAPEGLAGVAVADTAVGDVRGREGFYHYRQYSATELAERRTLEDVWYLLLHGQLPDAEQAAAFGARMRRLRRVPDRLQPVLGEIARAGGATALDPLRSAVSVLAASRGMRPWMDVDADGLLADAEYLCAVTPTLVMALHRMARDEQPISPHEDLPAAANYLYMLDGAEPGPDEARALEQYLITTIDHGFNASTFTARVVASTAADLGAAVTAAIGALSGPLHGGAPSRALDMLDDIADPAQAAAWARDAVARGDRIMGFGHRVYRTEDPRSALLRAIAERLGGDRVAFAREVERQVVEVLAELKPGRELYANVEFYAGVVMERCGLPRALFTPTFAASRVIGWCAHVVEQASANRIIRPSARYVGPPPPQPVPVPPSAGR